MPVRVGCLLVMLGYGLPAFAAPTAPGQCTEESPDVDYDGDGAYTIFWSAASDPQSGIKAYMVQEKMGAVGGWRTLVSSWNATRFPVRGRLDKTRYVYQVRAQNRAGVWGAWSPSSDGVLIDKTAPTPVTVTDDGATLFSTTTLHAAWTASTDPESSILQYDYLLRRDSTAGTILVNWTAAGLATEVTRSGLSLVPGKRYFVGVRAKNGARLYSIIRYSDGITVQPDIVPPAIQSLSPTPSPSLYAGNLLTLSAVVTDADPSPVEYRFSVDGTVVQPWGASATYPWVTTSALAGPHTITVEVRDPGGADSKTQTLYLYYTPPGPP